MVESLQELNKICQKPRYKEVGNWMARHIFREAALPVTWLLVHTPVTANQVTLLSLIIGVFGTICFASLADSFFLLGALCLQFWYLLDHVDGQLARYYKTASLSGRFFDFMTHQLIHGVILFALGVYVFRVTGHFFYLIWGFIASLGIIGFNIISDTKYKTFFECLLSSKNPVTLRTQMNRKELLKETPGFLRCFFSLLHKMIEIHVMMNVFTLFALSEIFVQQVPLDSRFWLFLFYGAITPVLAIVKISYLIHNREVDEEYHRYFGISA